MSCWQYRDALICTPSRQNSLTYRRLQVFASVDTVNMAAAAAMATNAMAGATVGTAAVAEDFVEDGLSNFGT